MRSHPAQHGEGFDAPPTLVFEIYYFLFFTLQKKCQVLKIGSLRASAG